MVRVRLITGRFHKRQDGRKQCVRYFFSIRLALPIVRHGLPNWHFTSTGIAGGGKMDARRNRRKEAKTGDKKLCLAESGGC
jgi:hypothetical protein